MTSAPHFAVSVAVIVTSARSCAAKTNNNQGEVMSRSRTRARKRRALLVLAHTQKEVRQANFEAQFRESLRRVWSASNSIARIEATDNLIKLIHCIAASDDVLLWPFENWLFTEEASNKIASEEREEIHAIFAQAVAWRLGGMASGVVHHRHSLGEPIN